MIPIINMCPMSWAEFFYLRLADVKTTDIAMIVLTVVIAVLTVLVWLSSRAIECSTKGTQKAAEETTKIAQQAADDAATRFANELVRQDWIALHQAMMEFEDLRWLLQLDGSVRPGRARIISSTSDDPRHQTENRLLACQTRMLGQLQRMIGGKLHIELVNFFDRALKEGNHLLWEAPSAMTEFENIRNKVALRCDPTFPKNIPESIREQVLNT